MYLMETLQRSAAHRTKQTELGLEAAGLARVKEEGPDEEAAAAAGGHGSGSCPKLNSSGNDVVWGDPLSPSSSLQSSDEATRAAGFFFSRREEGR